MDQEKEEETLAARRKKLKRARANAQRADARAMTKAGLSFAEQSTRALPRELLLRIFAMATELPADVPDDAPEDDARRSTHRTGAIPLVPKLASTCRAFRDVLRERPESVWRVVDLSYGWCRPSDAVIRRLCASGQARPISRQTAPRATLSTR